MKTILYSVVIGSVALALTAGAQQDRDTHAARARPQPRAANVHAARPATAARPASMPATARAQRNVTTAQNRQQRSYPNMTPRTNSNFVANRNARLQSMRERNFAMNERMRERNLARNQEFRARRDVAVNRDRNVAVNRTRNAEINRNRDVNEFRRRNEVALDRERNFSRTQNADVNRFRNTNEFRNRNNIAINQNRNVTVNRTQNAAFYRGSNVRVTNNWRGDAFRGQRYWAFRNYNRQWHDRGWWRSHYTRIVFVNNGWWYWNAGYWFPAWGYAPGITYAYDGPIYGYNGLSPDQVTVNVQEALAAAGYYDGPIDGELGPMTREAIANYQADNGLAVTSAIDEPTLATMGLV